MTATPLPKAFFRPIEFGGKPLGGGDVPAICIPLVARERSALLNELRAVLALGPDIVEWRVDHFLTSNPPTSTPDTLRDLRSILDSASSSVPFIFTLRSQAQGGEPCGLDADRAAAIIVAAIDSGSVQFVDLELTAPAELAARARAAAHRANVRTIVSWHDFSGTPPAADIFDRLQRAVAAGGDVAKVAVMPRSMADVLALFEASERAYREIDRPLITMAMGPLGGVTRVFGGMFGSSLTFAAGAASSAPGQWPAESLRSALEVIRSRSLPR